MTAGPSSSRSSTSAELLRPSGASPRADVAALSWSPGRGSVAGSVTPQEHRP